MAAEKQVGDRDLVAESLRELERAKAVGADLPQPDLPEPSSLHLPKCGVTVHFHDTGEHPSGRTFLLIHGLGGTMANWETVIGDLREQGRIIAPDLPGFGRTQAPAASAHVELLTDAVAELLAKLGVKSVEVAGNSMGGMIAVLLASRLQNPGQSAGSSPGGTVELRRLVLIDAVLPTNARHRPRPLVAATFGLYLCGPLARRVVPWYVNRIGLERLAIDGVVAQVAQPLRVPKWAVRRCVEETRIHADMPDAVGALVEAAGSLVRAGFGRTYRRQLDALACTVTVLHGEKDGMVPIGAARATAARYPAWRFVEAPDVGHVPMYEVGPWVAWEISQTC